MIPKSCRLFGQDHAQNQRMIPKSCRLFGQDHAQNQRMIPKSCRLFGQDHAQNQREPRALSVQRYRKKRSKMFRTILIANDGSEPAFHALALALTIAKENGAALHMVSVVEV